MITNLKIERFKSIRDVELDFGRVNLFIGGNGSGKSNLLEAIGVVSSALNRGLSDTDFSKKGVRITPPALMKSAFKNYDLPKSLTIKVKLDNIIDYYCSLISSESELSLGFRHESCTLNGRPMFGRSPNGASACGIPINKKLDKYRGIWDQTRALTGYPDELTSRLDQLASYAIYSPQTEFLRGTKAGTMDSPPVGLHGEGLPAGVSSFLKDIHRLRRRNDGENGLEFKLASRAMHLVFEPKWAQRVQVGSLPNTLKSRELINSGDSTVFFIDRFMHAKRNKLSVYDSSEGTLFLLFAAILIGHKDSPKIFAMDNVDSALNPALTRKLLECIIDGTKISKDAPFDRGPEQVFLTSHNPTSLDAFDIFDDDTRIFVVARKENGETTAKRLDIQKNVSKEEWRIASNGRNLSQMWIDGEMKGALGEII